MTTHPPSLASRTSVPSLILLILLFIPVRSRSLGPNKLSPALSNCFWTFYLSYRYLNAFP